MNLRFASANAVFLLLGQLAAAPLDEATRKLAHDIFQQLIEINTTDSVGSTTVAADAMAKRLLAAGFAPADIKVLGPNNRKGNLVVRYRGTDAAGLKPILIIGHLDVVEARREDWSTDPFQFVEKDGYFYGRGTQDMKVNDAILVTTFIRFKREGYRPDRDIILALTADEEGGSSNGVDWLLKNHRDLVDAAFGLNADAGGVTTVKGKPLNVDVEANEKLYADFELDASSPGGHSSLPVPDNAIYHIADALSRLERAPFPFELNPVTRTYFERRAALEAGQTASDMKAIPRNPAGFQSDYAAFQGCSIQFADADHMRGHALESRAREQCAAARRAGDCELPHPARPWDGGNTPGADPAFRRSESYGEVCGQCGPGLRSRSRDKGVCADPAAG